MNHKLALSLISLSLLSFKPIQEEHSPKIKADNYIKPKYSPLPLGAIKPKGWLKDQMEIMLKGTTGHLDEVYAKVRDDNGWLGGKGDAWEETPYWLDGAVSASLPVG